MEKSPRDMTIDEAKAHYGLPAYWEAPEVAAWVMARCETPPAPEDGSGQAL